MSISVPTFLPSPALAALLVAVAAVPSAAQNACSWTPAANAPIARLESPSVVVDGRLIVFGGFMPNLKATTRVDAYDPVLDSWSSLANMPTPVTHAGCALDDRTVWIAGGFVGDHPGPVTADVWTYDVDTNAWSAALDLPAPRGSGGLFRIARGLHFAGGVNVDRDTDMPQHWVLDLDNPVAWVPSDPLPMARNHFGTAVHNGRGYVIGGQFHHDTNPQDLPLVHAWASHVGWTQLADLPYPRSHFEPSVFVLGGEIALAGGRSIPLGLETMPDVAAYDPLANAWSVKGYLPQSLIAPAIKVIGAELVLAGGGPTENQPTVATYRRPASLVAPTHLRSNSGGGALALTQSWCADLGPVGGKPYTNSAAGGIAGTDDDALYWSARTGSDANPQHFGYLIPIPSGKYVVHMHFAEIYWGATGGAAGGAGARVFDASIEGQKVLDDYDIVADVGTTTAVVHTFATAVQDQRLDLSFDSSADRPLLSGLRVAAISDAGHYCVGAPNSVGPGARMAWGGSLAVSEQDLTLVVSGCPPSAPGLFLQSQSQTQVPFGNGFLCVGAPFFRLLPITTVGASGSALRVLDFDDPSIPAAQILAGSTWKFQFWYRDAAVAQSNLSDALSLTFVP
jgi:hypothetical protein